MKYQYLLVVTPGLEQYFMKHRCHTVLFSSNIYNIQLHTDSFEDSGLHYWLACAHVARLNE
jgi:hypothetical protein